MPPGGSTGVTAYAGASPTHPLGLNTVSTTNGKLPASIAGTRQNAAAPLEAPEVTAPDPESVPDWATPEPTTEPEELPPVTTELPLVPPTGLLAMLPLAGLDVAVPALAPVLEPAAPALEP